MVPVCDCEEEERKKMEQYHIYFIKPSLNCKNAFGRNPQSVIRKNAKWRLNNVDKTKQYRQKKYKCECGSELSWVHRARHNATLKHQRFLASSSC